jgi:peptide/nickel transport system substrate-binding protein
LRLSSGGDPADRPQQQGGTMDHLSGDHRSGLVGRRHFLMATGAGLVSLVVAACSSDSASAPTTAAPAGTDAPADTASGSTEAPADTAPADTAAPDTAAPDTAAPATVVGPPGAGDPSGGTPGGSIRVGWNAAANSYDPSLGFDGHAWGALTGLLVTPPLAYADQTGRPAPAGLAEMPATTDGLVHTLTLRPDLTFHNGRTVVAADYQYAWTRVLLPDTASWAAAYLSSIAGAADVMAGTATELSGVRVIDDVTLEVTLASPSVLFLDLLCQPYMAALPKEEVEAAGDAFATQVVGTGPYKLVSYDDSAQEAVFAKHDGWPWTGLPYVDEITFAWGITAENQVLQIKSGDLDIIGEGITSPTAAQAAADTDLADLLTAIDLPANMWLAVKATKAPLDDVRVRQALNYAIDRDQLATTAPGINTGWGLPFPETLAEYERTAQPYGYDPDKAKALLAEAGVTDLKLGFVTNLDPKVGEILQQQLEDVGITLDIQAVTTQVFYDLIFTDEVDIFPFPWAMVQQSALDIINSVWISTGGLNLTGYSNPTVDDLAAKALAAPDLAASNLFVAELEQTLTEDAAGIFVFSLSFLAAVRPRIQNWNYRAETTSQYDRLWVED